MTTSTTFSDFVDSLGSDSAATEELRKLAGDSDNEVSADGGGPSFESFDAFRRA